VPSRSLRGNDKGDVDVPRLDFRQQFDSEDFVFDLQGADPEVEGEAGTVKVANLGSVPVLSDEGVSYALVEIEPCGLNLPHHHPRAAEFGYIVKSESSIGATRLHRGEHRAADHERHRPGTGCLGAGRFGPLRAELGL
ncbi:unnamed protein product, partial [Laminaria digitata]